MTRHRVLWASTLLAFVLLVLLTDSPLVSVAVAVIAGHLIFRTGFALLGALARPVPEPPPPGELRKVKLVYRCPICSTEVRMTVANDEMPDPPRHCMDEMDLVTPVE